MNKTLTLVFLLVSITANAKEPDGVEIISVKSAPEFRQYPHGAQQIASDGSLHVCPTDIYFYGKKNPGNRASYECRSLDGAQHWTPWKNTKIKGLYPIGYTFLHDKTLIIYYGNKS